MGGEQGGSPWQSRCEYSLDLKEKDGREKLDEKRNDQAVVKMPARDMPKSERDAALAAAKREMVETTAAVNILSSARSNHDRKRETRYGESVNEPLASNEAQEEMKKPTAKLTEELELATTALQDVEARYGETVNKMQKEMQQQLQLNQKLDEQLKKESAKAMHASTSLLQLNRNLEEQLQEAAAKQVRAMHSSTEPGPASAIDEEARYAEAVNKMMVEMQQHLLLNEKLEKHLKEAAAKQFCADAVDVEARPSSETATQNQELLENIEQLTEALDAERFDLKNLREASKAHVHLLEHDIQQLEEQMKSLKEALNAELFDHKKTKEASQAHVEALEHDMQQLEEQLKEAAAKQQMAMHASTEPLPASAIDVEAIYVEAVIKMHKEMQQLLQLNEKLEEQLKEAAAKQAKAMYASPAPAPTSATDMEARYGEAVNKMQKEMQHLLQLNQEIEEQLQEGAAKQAKAIHSIAAPPPTSATDVIGELLTERGQLLDMLTGPWPGRGSMCEGRRIRLPEVEEGMFLSNEDHIDAEVKEMLRVDTVWKRAAKLEELLEMEKAKVRELQQSIILESAVQWERQYAREELQKESELDRVRQRMVLGEEELRKERDLREVDRQRMVEIEKMMTDLVGIVGREEKMEQELIGARKTVEVLERKLQSAEERVAEVEKCESETKKSLEAQTEMGMALEVELRMLRERVNDVEEGASETKVSLETELERGRDRIVTVEERERGSRELEVALDKQLRTTTQRVSEMERGGRETIAALQRQLQTLKKKVTEVESDGKEIIDAVERQLKTALEKLAAAEKRESETKESLEELKREKDRLMSVEKGERDALKKERDRLILVAEKEREKTMEVFKELKVARERVVDVERREIEATAVLKLRAEELQRTREQGAAMEALLKRECERERREGESVRARLTQLEASFSRLLAMHCDSTTSLKMLLREELRGSCNNRGRKSAGAALAEMYQCPLFYTPLASKSHEGIQRQRRPTSTPLDSYQPTPTPPSSARMHTSSLRIERLVPHHANFDSHHANFDSQSNARVRPQADPSPSPPSRLEPSKSLDKGDRLLALRPLPGPLKVARVASAQVGPCREESRGSVTALAAA